MYCAPNPAGALLQALVHAEVDIEDLPVSFRYLEIEAPGTLGVEDVDASTLARSWRTDLPATRRAGDRWLHSGRTALLRVPSAIVPETWNILINPRHAESAQARVVRTHNHGLDPRLLR